LEVKQKPKGKAIVPTDTTPTGLPDGRDVIVLVGEDLSTKAQNHNRG